MPEKMTQMCMEMRVLEIIKKWKVEKTEWKDTKAQFDSEKANLEAQVNEEDNQEVKGEVTPGQGQSPNCFNYTL